MFREVFIGRNPSHFQINPVVKAFITSEVVIWSAWNFSMPILAIFAVSNIQGGSVEVAAFSVSIHLIIRVVFELLSGRFLLGATLSKKYLATIIGLLIIGLSFIGFANVSTVPLFYIMFGITGIGLGIASPAKNSIFSTHLDKNKETVEWGVYDASVFVGMALSAALGGLIAKQYGFPILFYISAVLNFIGILPYLLYIKKFR